MNFFVNPVHFHTVRKILLFFSLQLFIKFLQVKVAEYSLEITLQNFTFRRICRNEELKFNKRLSALRMEFHL